jgi:hypothetical protein
MEDRKRLEKLGFIEKHECGLVFPCDLREDDPEHSNVYEGPENLVRDSDYESECGEYCGWHSYRYGSC